MLTIGQFRSAVAHAHYRAVQISSGACTLKDSSDQQWRMLTIGQFRSAVAHAH